MHKFVNVFLYVCMCVICWYLLLIHKIISNITLTHTLAHHVLGDFDTGWVSIKRSTENYYLIGQLLLLLTQNPSFIMPFHPCIINIILREELKHFFRLLFSANKVNSWNVSKFRTPLYHDYFAYKPLHTNKIKYTTSRYILLIFKKCYILH